VLADLPEQRIEQSFSGCSDVFAPEVIRGLCRQLCDRLKVESVMLASASTDLMVEHQIDQMLYVRPRLA
jgi:hypothetical protein